MNRADNLPMVLGIGDTVFLLKNIFVMGGLVITGVTGVYLTIARGLPVFNFSDAFIWLGLSQLLFIVIAINSCMILLFMILGRRGRRRFYRFIPAMGYNNIGLIILVYVQMVLRPTSDQQWLALALPLALMIAADIAFILRRKRQAQRLAAMTPKEFSEHYFHLLNTEKMYELLRLFDDDAVIIDTFATKPVVGMLAIEKFFQFLGDQFDDIRIEPQSAQSEAEEGEERRMLIRWIAHGTTKNGLAMMSLAGVNRMTRKGMWITKMEIDFDLRQLPQMQLYTPAT
jgi:hypothetical protein